MQKHVAARLLTPLADSMRCDLTGIQTLVQLPALLRRFSSKPESSIYGGPKVAGPQRETLRSLRKKYLEGKKLTMVTAYDYPSAVHVDQAGIDILLVGDSVGMVVHGHDTTLPVTLDDMISHCRAVARGAARPFLVGDMPFGSYEVSTTQAVTTAVRLLKEGSMDAVKMEGGSPARVVAAAAIVGAGVACMGHVGLTPQSVSAIGGFRPQAQLAADAMEVVRSAQRLEDAGCFALVLECVPAPVAAAVTRAVSVPTIGIGAGPACSGQVLVFHDLLAMMSHPHHAKVTPKFCKQYAQIGQAINSALLEYKADVEGEAFPGRQFSPYRMKEEEIDAFADALANAGLTDAAEATHSAAPFALPQARS